MAYIKKSDVILLVSVLAGALILFLCYFLFAPKGTVAVVMVDGVELARLPLAEDTSVEVNGGTHRVVIADGCVSIDNPSCADNICAMHAPISTSGQSIVCLPYRLVITVEEGSP